MNEPKPTPEAFRAAVAPFLSQTEDEAGENEEGFFGSSNATAASQASVAVVERVAAPRFDPDFDSEFETGEAGMVAAAAKPQFAEMSEEPTYTPLPRDYAADFGTGTQGENAAAEGVAQSASALFEGGEEESQRDLDTPTFLRRLRF